MALDTLPRQLARTRRFSLGHPARASVSPDGGTVFFLRSRAGDDPVSCLWAVDCAAGAERLLADPVRLLAGAAEQLPDEELTRRERTREMSGGIVGYAADEPPEAYDRCSPVLEAASLRVPLLLVHGLADDNVIPAHTLRLSAALLAAGRPHEVLPLPRATHLPAGEDVAAHLLLHELDFLRRALGVPRQWRADARPWPVAAAGGCRAGRPRYTRVPGA